MIRMTNYGVWVEDDGHLNENEIAINYVLDCARLAGVKVIEDKTALDMQFMAEVMKGLRSHIVNPQEPCEDAISRAEAIKAMDALEQADIETFGCSIPECFDGKRAIKTLQSLPPVKPQEKTGYWVEENINGCGRKVFCSECGCPPPFEHISSGDVYSASGYGVINKTKFCPNCGTRMIEPQESEVSK